jgi:hypothetical protein
VLLLGLPLLLSCASEELGPPGIELGTGLVTYAAVVEDDGVEIVLGPQGGWHINVAARLWNLDPESIDLEYELVLDDADRPANYPARYALTGRRVIDIGDHYVRVGDRLVLDIDSPSDVVGRGGTLRVRAMQRDTELTVASRHVFVVDVDP